MISSLQPSRPRYPLQSLAPPLNQQPARPLSSTSNSAPTYTPPRPRTQIEAMPPNILPKNPLQVRQVLLDASIRHPVFFTDRLKRAPTGVNAGNGNWVSPVAMGYVFNDGVRRAEGGVKL